MPSWHGQEQLYLFAFLVKGKAIPLQAWTGREGSRGLKLPDYEGGKVVSPMHQPT